MKTQLISKLTMWILLGLAIVLLVLSFVLGEDTGTDILMFGMYAYGAIMVIGMIANAVMSVMNKDWGLIRVIGAVLATAILTGICYLIASGEGDELIAGAFCYSIYALTILAVIAVIGCATGIIYKLGNKN